MASSLPLLLLVLCSLTVAEAQLKLFNLRASRLRFSLVGITDAYVKVFCGHANLGKTSVRYNNQNPWWQEQFSHFNSRENDILRLEVHDNDILFDDKLGVCQEQIRPGTHDNECALRKGGTLHYSYTLDVQ